MGQSMKGVIVIFISTILVTLITSCNKIDSNEQLELRVNQYYSFEKDKNWRKTFEYRTKKFRDVIKYDKYSEEMNKGSEGWSLQSAKIKEVIIDGDMAKVVLIFKETPPDSYFEKFNLPKNKTNTARTVTTKAWGTWVFENGNWYCQDAVSRTYLYMNGAQIW